MLLFKNPQNGYIEKSDLCWLWCLFFCFFYLAYKGAWLHAIAGFFLALITAGISWLVYPFFAKNIVRKAYLRRGWQEVKQAEQYEVKVS